MGLSHKFFNLMMCLATASITYTKPVIARDSDPTGTSHRTDIITGDTASCNSSFQRRYHHPKNFDLSGISFPAPPSFELHNTIKFEEQTFAKNMKAKLGTDSELKRMRLTDNLKKRGYILIFVGTTKSNAEHTQFEALVIQSRTDCWLRVRASSLGAQLPPQQQLFHLIQLIEADEQASNASRR